MTAPYLAPSLFQLRYEFGQLAPNRDTASDGWIGDTAHSSRTSDHNPDARGMVHAIDVDKDLRRPGLDMERVVQFLLARCRSGAEDRLKYVIYRQRIWEESRGWRQRVYTGINAHKEHAHCSAKSGSAHELSRASWRFADLLEDDVQQDDIEKIANLAADLTVERLLARKLDDPYITDDPKNPGADDKTVAAYIAYAASKGTAREVQPQVAALSMKVDELTKLVKQLLPKSAPQ